jgi:hypothetical protein
MKPPSSSTPPPSKKSSTMEKGNGWKKFVNALGLLGWVVGIVSLMGGVSTTSFSNLPFLSHVNDFLRKTVPGSLGVIDESAKYRNGCPLHQFDSIKVLSRSPDIMVIEGFLSKFEADYLVRLAYLPLPPSEILAGLIVRILVTPFLKIQGRWIM